MESVMALKKKTKPESDPVATEKIVKINGMMILTRNTFNIPGVVPRLNRGQRYSLSGIDGTTKTTKEFFEFLLSKTAGKHIPKCHVRRNGISYKVPVVEVE